MENFSAEELYLIDLTYAPTPADIVFELSTILEQEPAHNQNIHLKIADVDLNQSQLLSINSLINSINSTLVLISSPSLKTSGAAEALGYLTKPKEEEKTASSSNQYIQMTDHLETETVQEDSEVIQDEKPENEKEPAEEMTASEISSDKIVQKDYIELKENEKQEEKEEPLKSFVEQDCELTVQESVKDSFEDSEEQAASPSYDEPLEKDAQEIQSELDSIFDSEMKLESIFANESKNFPEAKDGFEIEIPQEEELTEEDYEIRKMPTKYLKQTVRSGQVVKSQGNVVIIGDCHPGSEVHAKGDITVWGALGGIALAGSEGNKKARIRALQLNAIQLRIGDFYARRPDSSNIIYVEKTSCVTPEEARVLNDNIVILKLND